MKLAIELVKILRCELRMFGMPIDGPASMCRDNEAAHKNMSIPESALSKKMHVISYHFYREALAADIIHVAKEDTLTNLADLFKKVMGKEKRDDVLGRFMC